MDRTCHKHHRQFQSGEEKLGSSGHLGDRCTPNPEITLLACSCRAPPLQGGDLVLLWTPFGPFHENWPLKNLQVNTISLDSARGELLSLKSVSQEMKTPCGEAAGVIMSGLSKHPLSVVSVFDQDVSPRAAAVLKGRTGRQAL